MFSSLLDIENNCKLGIDETSSGICPVSLLSARTKFSNFFILPISDGNDPDNSLP